MGVTATQRDCQRRWGEDGGVEGGADRDSLRGGIAAFVTGGAWMEKEG